jgi:hypothetical protein
MRYFNIFGFCIALLAMGNLPCYSQGMDKQVAFEFYDKVFNLQFDKSIIIDAPDSLSARSVNQFYNKISAGNYQPIVDSLTNYKNKHQLNDWLYYQLVRKVAQQISPKTQNYDRYTLYKWFLMTKSGYDARLAIANKSMVFYVLNEEDVSDLPFFIIDKKKYTTLNYHDLGNMDLHKYLPLPVNLTVPYAVKPFSYKVTRMPDFKPEDYYTKQINFDYKNKSYNFSIRLNADVDRIFNNYPVVDYESYFNIPLSKETYNSIVPFLAKNVKAMNQNEDDEHNFGKEKRLSPERTLSSDRSDCDDRAALFFYLVKEIYDLPMIAVLYPTHINIAVQFNKPIGQQIVYNGKSYSVCEPTPQLKDLGIGQLSSNLKNSSYQIVYNYDPINR